MINYNFFIALAFNVYGTNNMPHKALASKNPMEKY